MQDSTEQGRRTRTWAVRDAWAFQRWAFEQVTGSVARKAVLSNLATMADKETGRCQAKQVTIAEHVELSERAVRGHLAALEQAGLIARRAQFRRDGRRRGDEYLLLAPWVDEWPDGEPVLPPADSSGGQIDRRQPASGHNRKPASGQERATKKNGETSSSAARAKSAGEPSGLVDERWVGVDDEMRRDAEALLKAKTKVGTRQVTATEMQIAAAAVSEYNRQADSDFGLGGQLPRVVGRIRERPSWDAAKHVRLVQSAWRIRWWEKRNPGRRPTPQVIYGNAEVFERVANDASQEAKGRTVTIEMSLKERRYSGGRTWDELTANEQAAAKENASMGIMPEDHRKVRDAPPASSEPWNPEPLTVENF